VRTRHAGSRRRGITSADIGAENADPRCINLERTAKPDSVTDTGDRSGRVRCADRDHIVVPRTEPGREPRSGGGLVACRSHDQGTKRPSVIDRRIDRAAIPAPETEVDDVGTETRRVPDSGGDVAVAARIVGTQNADGEDRRIGGNAGRSEPVARSRDRARDMRSVTTDIIRVGIVVGEIESVNIIDESVLIVIDPVARNLAWIDENIFDQIGMIEVDTCVDDRDEDTTACVSRRPRLGGTDGIDVPFTSTAKVSHVRQRRDYERVRRVRFSRPVGISRSAGGDRCWFGDRIRQTVRLDTQRVTRPPKRSRVERDEVVTGGQSRDDQLITTATLHRAIERMALRIGQVQIRVPVQSGQLDSHLGLPLDSEADHIALIEPAEYPVENAASLDRPDVGCRPDRRARVGGGAGLRGKRRGRNLRSRKIGCNRPHQNHRLMTIQPIGGQQPATFERREAAGTDGDKKAGGGAIEKTSRIILYYDEFGRREEEGEKWVVPEALA